MAAAGFSKPGPDIEVKAYRMPQVCWAGQWASQGRRATAQCPLCLTLGHHLLPGIFPKLASLDLHPAATISGLFLCGD